MPARTLSSSNSTRPVIPRHLSLSQSSSTKPPPMHPSPSSDQISDPSSICMSVLDGAPSSYTNPETQAGADLDFGDAPNLSNPNFGQWTTTTKDEASKQMGCYFWDGINNNSFGVDFNYRHEFEGQRLALPLTRGRGLLHSRLEKTGQNMTILATTDTTTTSHGQKAGERLASVSSGNGEDERAYNGDGADSWDELPLENALNQTRPCGHRHRLPLSPLPDSPHYKSFWEAELAAQRELEEDEHAWYYKNPNRSPWTLRMNSSSSAWPKRRAENRARIGDEAEAEKFPTKTNRTLFAGFVGRYFKDLKVALGGCCESDANRKATSKPATVVVCGGEDDWHEELFSPSRGRRRFTAERDTEYGLNGDSYSRASSMESYTSSSSESSAVSEEKSAQSYYEMDVGALPPGGPVLLFSGRVTSGGIQVQGRYAAGVMESKRGASVRSGVVGRRRFSFLRIST